MSRDLLTRYIWIVDTIRRHGSITRTELNDKWRRAPFSEGQPLTRRTFYNYRQAIQELFNLDIECNPATYEYSIASSGTNNDSITDWLLNTAAMSHVLTSSRDVSDRIFVEEVPSARTHLDAVIEALKSHHPIRFTYHSYYRSQPQPGVVIEPYFLKLFRQRWYITGRNLRDRKLKTYALDRMSSLSIESDTFKIPEDFCPEEYFRNSFGIVFDEGEPKHVSIMTDSRQAKYFRELPLHRSQQEHMHDTYSIFHYTLKLTPDFLQELLGYGSRLTVLNPPELRAMMVTSLRESLANYDS